MSIELLSSEIKHAFAKRDAAREDFLRRRPSAEAVEAFNAGWEARKRAEYDSIVERAQKRP